MRLPGMRNERGTHVGASRKMPCAACKTWRRSVASALAGAEAGLVVGLAARGGLVGFAGAVFLAMLRDSRCADSPIFSRGVLIARRQLTRKQKTPGIKGRNRDKEPQD